MHTTDAIGWLSSVILLLTVGKQVHKQWVSGTSEGVSKWLFAGQMAASAGFAVYSWLLENRVFVFTNTLMIVNGLVGYMIVLRNKHRGNRAAG